MYQMAFHVSILKPFDDQNQYVQKGRNIQEPVCTKGQELKIENNLFLVTQDMLTLLFMTHCCNPQTDNIAMMGCTIAV